jgi:hypothetical protein
MTETKPQAKDILQDPVAESAHPQLPAFLARPEGAPVYHGFPLIAETETNGWLLGAITAFEDPNGCEFGDAFVQAPDGSRAGLVWEVGSGRVEQIVPPDTTRWGVWAVWFQRPVRSVEDLVVNFRAVLPELKKRHAQIRGGA